MEGFLSYLLLSIPGMLFMGVIAWSLFGQEYVEFVAGAILFELIGLVYLSPMLERKR